MYRSCIGWFNLDILVCSEVLLKIVLEYGNLVFNYVVYFIGIYMGDFEEILIF